LDRAADAQNVPREAYAGASIPRLGAPSEETPAANAAEGANPEWAEKLVRSTLTLTRNTLPLSEPMRHFRRVRGFTSSSSTVRSVSLVGGLCQKLKRLSMWCPLLEDIDGSCLTGNQQNPDCGEYLLDGNGKWRVRRHSSVHQRHRYVGEKPKLELMQQRLRAYLKPQRVMEPRYRDGRLGHENLPLRRLGEARRGRGRGFEGRPCRCSPR
jgi:hypothetical protein